METRTRETAWIDGFEDRRDAGRLLAVAVERGGALAENGRPLVVVGLARGGVEVAAEVAERLDAPLDALAVRKVGHPWQPEYGIGAVAPGGVQFVRASDGLTSDEIAEAVRSAEAKASALDAELHAGRARLPIAGARCLLVDDGLATGGTMVAATRWARARGATQVVVAVPIGAAPTVRVLEQDPDVDTVVCLGAPAEFGAVGFWYRSFRQLEDDDVLALLDAAHERTLEHRAVEIASGGATLPGDLTLPALATGCVLFAHGSGSSRRSRRNRQVAAVLERAGIVTLLFDLLTPAEELDRRNVFDVELLARRLEDATDWLSGERGASNLPLGYFGASTGAAAALVAAANRGASVSAVVSRGGRPDLASDRLADVEARTLLIVGGADQAVLELNRSAAKLLSCRHEVAIVPGATHLFEEPGALEDVATLARAWLLDAFAASAAEPN